MSETALEKISAARRAIAEAKTIDEIKAIRDKAEAVRVYAKQAGLTQEIVNDAAEIKIRAEYRAGQLLREMQERGERDEGKGGNRGNQHVARSHDATVPTLTDLGLNKTQSSRWQLLATIPESEFDEKLTNERAAVRELTSGRMLRSARISQKQMSREEQRIITADSGLQLGDFRELSADIPDASVDLIFTER